MLAKIGPALSRLWNRLVKKTPSPHVIGMSFVDLIVLSRSAKQETRSVLAALTDTERERVRFETMLLQGFVIEYVTAEVFRDRPETQGILTAYHGALDHLAGQDPVWEAFTAELRQRLPRYAAAALAPTLDQRLSCIGDIFAGACGDAGNRTLSTLGIIEFEMQYVATYKQCRTYIGAFA